MFLHVPREEFHAVKEGYHALSHHPAHLNPAVLPLPLPLHLHLAVHLLVVALVAVLVVVVSEAEVVLAEDHVVVALAEAVAVPHVADVDRQTSIGKSRLGINILDIIDL